MLPLDELSRHCGALRLFLCRMLNGRGAMETLIVCGDYRHAGMMSCTGCVCIGENLPHRAY